MAHQQVILDSACNLPLQLTSILLLSDGARRITTSLAAMHSGRGGELPTRLPQ